MAVQPGADLIGREFMNERKLLLWKSGGKEPTVARIAIGGDFLPAGTIEWRPPDEWSGAARTLAPHFENVATSFVNLECAIDTGGLAARKLAGLGSIVSAPPAALDYLAAIRAEAVGFANNHAYDFGAAGLARTRTALDRHHMILMGAGNDTGTAPDVHMWRGPEGIKVGLWAAAKASHDLARRGSAGVEPATPRRAKQALELMKSRGARLSIALLHAGVLRASRPDPGDLKLMDSIAEAGFDIVAASHSHRISGSKCVYAERGRPAFCFYGLGSMVSGYAGASIEREGLIVVAGLKSDGSLADVEVKPVWLAASGFGEAPSDEISRTILHRFQRLSAEIRDGSSQKLFYREVSQNIVKLYFRDARAAFRASGLGGLARKTGRLRLRHLRRLAHGLLS
ncbi:MAG TPA: CapA family protein [Candidatus Acidoferrales bacterium]|nr:CapA family protein [Candidatus Acidoferrales bacterium]